MISSGLRLANPYFNKSDGIDIDNRLELEAELFWDLQCIGRHQLDPNNPILKNSIGMDADRFSILTFTTRVTVILQFIIGDK